IKRRRLVMQRSHRIFIVLAAFGLASISPLRAQTIADPSGHWKGELQAPGMAVAFEVDFVRNAGGYTGAVSIPSPKLKGLPLTKSARVTSALEGDWDGTLEANGMSLRLELSLANHADGTATGHVVNVDQGGLRIPLTVTQNGAAVKLDFTVLAGASFSGTLD